MLLPFDTIVRSIDFDKRASGMQLRPWQWEFLLGADGRTRLGDLARSCAIDFETAADLVTETEALGLVEIVTLSLESYRAAAALLVMPVGDPTFAPAVTLVTPDVRALEAPAHPISFDVGALDIDSLDLPPLDVGPKKGVSVSFDSFSTMMTDFNAPPAFPETTPEHESTHELFVEKSRPTNVPIDFAFPTRMAPLADRPPFETYGDLFAPEPVLSHDASETNGLASEALPDRIHEVERKEHEHEHEHAHADERGSNGSVAHLSESSDIPANAHERVFENHDTYVSHPTPDLHQMFDSHPTHDAHEARPDVIDRVSPAEHVEHGAHVEDVAHVGSREPGDGTSDAAVDAPRKSVSFSLSADAFGLPGEPLDLPNPETYVGSPLSEPVSARSVAPKKDDVLLEHFGVDATAGAVVAPPAGEAALDTRTNSDLTGVVLRVLGLRR